jgi:hypothetical protein
MGGDIGSTAPRHQETDAAVRAVAAAHSAGRRVERTEVPIPQGDGCEWDGTDPAAPPRRYRVFVASMPRSAAH